MKKLLLMTAAMLTFGVALAHAADGMNLAWAQCRTTTNNALAAQNDMSTFTAGVCDDPGAPMPTRRLVCSMKNGTTLANWGGTTIQVNFYVAGGTVTDFWMVGPSGCRNGSVSAPATSLNSTNCANPYRPGGANNDPAGETESSNVDESAVGTGKISYQSDHVRNTVPINLSPPSAAGGWLVNNIAVDGNSNDICAGCAAAVCVELEFVKYFSTAESRTIAATELRNWVTVNGGNGGACSTAVPVKNTTWGQVKALYR
jgi:hypothetical protein